MSLRSNAAEENFVISPDSILEVVDGAMLEPQHMHSHDHGHGHVHDHDHDHGHGHNHGHNHGHEEMHSLIPNDSFGDIEIVISLPEVPGAANAMPLEIFEEPEKNEVEVIDVSSEDKVSDKKENGDENDARKSSKKPEKWDWESKGASGFVSWIKDRLDNVPTHSGKDTAGLERAISYLQKVDSEISKAMRLDLDGDLDANKIEEVRATIDDGLERLEERLSKIKKSKKGTRKRAELEYAQEGFIKEAQKITGVKAVYVTVPLLISRIARVCINGMTSAGHDIEDLYNRQVKYYKLSSREQAETMQLLADMGYPLRQDRGFLPEDALEVSDTNGMDWVANYKG